MADNPRVVVVTLAGRPYRLVGRAAAIAAMVAIQESEVNTPRLGEVRFRFAEKRVKMVVERHFAEVVTDG
jgi:hypothetical protein